MVEIKHGIPQHEYFGIIQPSLKSGGLDCSEIANGIGHTYKLVNPYNEQVVFATLVSRRTLYIDWICFDAVSYLLYGVDKHTLLDSMRLKYENMSADIVELWTFKKEK